MKLYRMYDVPILGISFSKLMGGFGTRSQGYSDHITLHGFLHVIIGIVPQVVMMLWSAALFICPSSDKATLCFLHRCCYLPVCCDALSNVDAREHTHTFVRHSVNVWQWQAIRHQFRSSDSVVRHHPIVHRGLKKFRSLDVGRVACIISHPVFIVPLELGAL